MLYLLQQIDNYHYYYFFIFKPFRPKLFIRLDQRYNNNTNITTFNFMFGTFEIICKHKPTKYYTRINITF